MRTDSCQELMESGTEALPHLIEDLRSGARLSWRVMMILDITERCLGQSIVFPPADSASVDGIKNGIISWWDNIGSKDTGGHLS